MTAKNCGSLAQLGEHLPYKQRVTGSSPVTSIFLFYYKPCSEKGIGIHPRELAH